MGKIDEEGYEGTRKLLEKSLRKAGNEATTLQLPGPWAVRCTFRIPALPGLEGAEHVKQALSQVTGMRSGSSAGFVRLAALLSFKLLKVSTDPKEPAFV